MNKNKKSHFKQLTLKDRITIEIRYKDGWSLRKIAKELGTGRTAGSICREINGKPRTGLGRYQAHIVHEQALKKRYGKKSTRLKNDLIQSYVIKKMKLGLDPKFSTQTLY